MKFKPIVGNYRRESFAETFQKALHASDRVAIVETPRTITFKLTKRKTRGTSPRSQ